MIRKIGYAVGRQGSAAIALSAWLLAVTAASATAAGADAAPGRGLPFSIVDLGWITVAMATLIVLASLLQAIARRRRRRPLHAVVPRRTDP